MASILAHCPVHGVIRAQNVFGGVGTVTVVGSAVTCPDCGRPARILDGDYTFDDHSRPGVTVFKPITRAQAVRLKTAVTWAKDQLDAGADGEMVKDKVDAVLEKHAPGWKKVIDQLLSERAVNLYQLLGFILMLLVFFGLDPASQAGDAPTAPEITDEQIRELFDEYLDEHGTESDTPPQPSPSPAEPTPGPVPTQEA